MQKLQIVVLFIEPMQTSFLNLENGGKKEKINLTIVKEAITLESEERVPMKVAKITATIEP